MNTPILDFVTSYVASDPARFHMPGHKGCGVLGCEARDITEVTGADVLSHADGIIAESEENATALFGSAHTFYSTEGSTLCIKAMLTLIRQNHPAPRPLILAARNAHKAFLYAAALLDLDVEWIYPTDGEHLCSCTVTPNALTEALDRLPIPPAAVYLTSPDYLGNTADIRALADVCHARGIPLLVDNAHGAYLKHLSLSLQPLDLGADLCCDSAHKTLPVLTGGAYLHVSKQADKRFLDGARAALALHASTSPSYLTLQSLDLCNRTLAGDYAQRLERVIRRGEELRTRLTERGFEITQSEPLKLVLNAPAIGYLGTELAELLHGQRIEVEYADEELVVLMFTPDTREQDWVRLERTLDSIPLRRPIVYRHPSPVRPERACTVREAMLSPHESVCTTQAIGRICAAPTVACPPAVPIVMSGERITEESVALLLHYGIRRIEVLK